LRNRLALAERRNRPDGVEVLLVRAELAAHLEEAITSYEVVVTQLEQSVGPDNVRTIAARAALAHYCWLADRVAEAVRMYESLLADSERVLGPDNATTRKVREHLLAARDGRPAP
jgi:hypothetical protein